MKNTIMYPGTFDPITKGHVDVIERAARLFDHIVVAVAANTQKTPAFSLNERTAMAKEVLQDHANVEVISFSGLLTQCAIDHGAKVILRGLRVGTDFDYEFQMAGMNHKLAPQLESLFLMPSEPFTYLSSSLVREISRLGGHVDQFVHPCVAKALSSKYPV